MKALVGAFNQEKALVGAFSVIVQLHRLIDLRHYKLFMTVVLSPRVDRVKNDLKLSLTLRISSLFEQIDMK